MREALRQWVGDATPLSDNYAPVDQLLEPSPRAKGGATSTDRPPPAQLKNEAADAGEKDATSTAGRRDGHPPPIHRH